MARTAKAKKALKEAPYVASNLNISYTIPVGLTAMLSRATKTDDKEVWCKLSEMANICAARLLVRLADKTGGRHGYHNSASSWSSQKFPGSNVTLRLDMDGYKQTESYDWQTKQTTTFSEPKLSFSCRIKISGTTTETFNQSQVDKYIMDKMEAYLFGDEEKEKELDEFAERFSPNAESEDGL